MKGSFFKQRRFLDDEDLVRQLADWHHEVNTRRPSRATGVIPEERMAEERPRLRPLKLAPDELALRVPIFVGPTGMVLHDTRTRCHPRPSILPEHRARHVAAVSGKRAKRYLQREHLLALGRAALEYLTELTHRRPQVWIRDVDRLHELLQLHGEAALRAAFERGLAEGVFGAEYVAHHLAAAPLPTGTGQQELPL